MIKDSYGNTRFYGVYRGVVYDANDPEGKGRLRLKIPQILADQPTEWAWPVENPGIETLTPRSGQGIWAMFEGGDLSYPIWLGQFGDAIIRRTVGTGSTVKIAAFSPGTPDVLDTLDTNYGAFQYMGDQVISSTTTAYAMPFDTTDFSNGVFISNTSRINFRTSGLYNIQWSGQFENSSNALEDISVWLRVNGVDVAGSSGRISIPARKSAAIGEEAHMVTGWNYYLNIKANQYVEVMWSASNTTVSLQSYPAGTSPVKPSTAAIIFTAQQVA
ncbi:hypothetical protein UFOVP223_109 [uncultured Caudovirales phage]|uniref:Gp5/Type VI secretion system Vgr protein OB-fold domain-containing protein n=1 Tax=uncultured Caudovirales phage TaxID=2100421 RepID=A0A6J5L2Q4_9CAUD|nr:hypothetical protein UFOVP110_55 [uncultured Caudovirales phage]CAB5219650.1 hypothetical protein UFOVP223_109 [uncultured Caudovirales phage]